MFSFARMRLLSFFALLPLAVIADPHEDVLFTSSVSYCQPPTAVLIERFDIAYFSSNSSISFNISAATEQAMNVSANIALNVYGMKPLNISLDICSILNRALCPLPAYNFTGASSITLPKSVDVTSQIPSIAYKIPDLEAFAQLTLTNTQTNEVVACVQATLSNGWSAHQTAVEWSTGGLGMLALAGALIHTSNPLSLAPVRLLDLMFLLQTIASSGLLALNYPSVYRAFTLNFSWALGLFRSASVQQSIDNTRSHTGGHLADQSGNAVGLVNRQLSPYNTEGMSALFTAPKALLTRLQALPRVTLSGLPAHSRRALAGLASSGEVQTVTSTSSNVLEAGIPIYVNSIGIETDNAFMTIFIVTLIFVAICIGLLGLIYGILLLLSRRPSESPRTFELRDRMPFYIRAWALRITMIVFLPIVTFALYQWTLAKDSWVPIFFSVIILLAVLAGIAFPSFSTIRLARREGPEGLHADADQLISHGPLHASYRPARWYAFLPTLAALFLRSLFIAVVQSNAFVQAILILVTEIFLFITLCILRPHPTRGNDVFQGYLSLTRVFGAGLLLAFVPSLHVKPIPRVAIGIVLALIWSVAVITLFVNLLLHFGLFSAFRRTPLRSDSGVPLVDEKGDVSPTSVMSQSTLPSAVYRDSSVVESPVTSPFRDPDMATRSFSHSHSHSHSHSLAHSRNSSDPFARDSRAAV